MRNRCYVKLGGHRRSAEVHRGRILTSTWSNAWGLFLLIRRTGALYSSTESGEDLNARVLVIIFVSSSFWGSPSISESFQCFQRYSTVSFHPTGLWILLGCGLVCWIWQGWEAITWPWPNCHGTLSECLRTENSTPVWQIFPHLQFIIWTESASIKNRQRSGVVAATWFAKNLGQFQIVVLQIFSMIQCCFLQLTTAFCVTLALFVVGILLPLFLPSHPSYGRKISLYKFTKSWLRFDKCSLGVSFVSSPRGSNVICGVHL